MFAIRRVVRVRAVTIARVFVPALLVAPLLIEPVLYDDDRVDMALAGAFFAAALAVLATRAPAGPPATTHYLATFALVTGLPAGLGWVAAFHRERVVELTARVRSLDSTIGRLARANREFQAYAGTVKSESAAEERSRITRELHDTVGYALTNVIVMMDAAKARAREDPESLDAIFQLTRAFEEAMGLSVELHVGNLPPTLGPRIDSVLFRLRIHRRKLDQGGRRVPPGQHDPRGLRAVQLPARALPARRPGSRLHSEHGRLRLRGSVRHRQGGTDQLPVRARPLQRVCGALEAVQSGPVLLRPREGATALPGRRLRLPRHRPRRGDRLLVGELHRRHRRRREDEPHPGPLRLAVQLGRHHDGHFPASRDRTTGWTAPTSSP